MLQGTVKIGVSQWNRTALYLSLAAVRTKLDGDRHFIHFLQTEHIYTLTWYAQFYILIS